MRRCQAGKQQTVAVSEPYSDDGLERDSDYEGVINSNEEELQAPTNGAPYNGNFSNDDDDLIIVVCAYV